MLKGIFDYIKNEEFSIKIWEDKIDIIYFKKIIILEENKIVFLSPNMGKITMKGENFTILKLLDNEVLIKGKLTSFEIGDKDV